MAYASTSASCADLTAKLIRVTACRAEFCCIGIARSTYLFGDQYQADEVHRWEFSLEPTSYVFAKGDRVRLEIAASAFPSMTAILPPPSSPAKCRNGIGSAQPT